MSVSRSGMDLVVENLSMIVEAQCAGLNSLQAMLLAGVFLACRFFPEHRVFWWMLPACAAAAWAANTLRILLITLAALTFSPEFAMGTFHNSGGLVALLLSFGLAAGGMRLVLAILAVAWRMVPLSDAAERVRSLPLEGLTFRGQDVPLDAVETNHFAGGMNPAIWSSGFPMGNPATDRWFGTPGNPRCAVSPSADPARLRC